jgi:hypothetical protein
MSRGFIVCLAFATCVAGAVACGDGGAEARSERSPIPSVSTTEARASSDPVVTSWSAQSKLPYHFATRPFVEFKRRSKYASAGYIVVARLNRRLHRVPKNERDDPDAGGKEGPTRGTLLLNGHGGDIWPGMSTISYRKPCYSRNFDQGDGRSDPPLFPPREDKPVTVTLHVPGQPRIAIQARAHRSTKLRTSSALRRLGCDS